MPQSSPLSWWERWFRRQQPPGPQSRPSRAARHPRRPSVPPSPADQSGQSARQRPASPADQSGQSAGQRPASPADQSGQSARQRPASPADQSGQSARQRPASPADQSGQSARQRPASPADQSGQSAGQRPAPPAASCPAIVIQPASSGESQGHDPSGEVSRPGPSGTNPPPSGHRVGVPCESDSGAARETERTDTAEAQSQQSEQPPPADESGSTGSSGLDNTNKVLLRSQSTTETPATGGDEQDNSPAYENPRPAYEKPHDAAVENLSTGIGECRNAIQGVKNFSYEIKEKKKISELAAEGQKLLQLWQEALNKKDVLAQIIRECTEAANQSGERLSRDVRELEQLYSELAEALANLHRTTSRHRAVKRDIKNMRSIVDNASSKEQAEVNKVAAAHEKEVYSRWQCLKSMAPDVEALEKLRRELMEKQRAVSGLDSLVRRRLEQLRRGETRTPAPTSGAPADPGPASSKGIPQRISPSSSRRAGAGRASGKRRLSDEARHERKACGGGQRGPLALRGHSPATTGGAATSGVTAAAVATQAGLLTGPPLGSPALVSVFTGPVSSPGGSTVPPPPPLPPAGPAAARLLRTAEDEDSGPADSGADTSTSNDEDAALEADQAALAEAFPLHFGPGLFDGLDPAEAARAMAEAINFH